MTFQLQKILSRLNSLVVRNSEETGFPTHNSCAIVLRVLHVHVIDGRFDYKLLLYLFQCFVPSFHF